MLKILVNVKSSELELFIKLLVLVLLVFKLGNMLYIFEMKGWFFVVVFEFLLWNFCNKLWLDGINMDFRGLIFISF